DRLQRAERADAVRAVAVLEAPEHLTVGDQRDRHQVEDDEEDRERLEDLHPPRLVEADETDHPVTSRGGGGSVATSATANAAATASTGPTRWTSTRPCVSTLGLFSAIPSARKTLPAGTASRILASAGTFVPLPTSTRSPSLIPSAAASAGESS